jgi:DNA-directed RNA polymerase subunit RPC12/RpoP
MSDKYICVTCEQANASNSLVELTQQGSCPQCGGSTVVSATKFAELAARELELQNAFLKIKSVSKPVDTTISDARRKRIESLAEAYKPIRRFLGRNKFIEQDLWWDGFAARVDYSCQPEDSLDEPAEGEQEFLTLFLKNADGVVKTLKFFFDPEDETLREVKP